MYYNHWNGNHRYHTQRQYAPVTAYTADRPIYVNGFDINTGLYPVLNFQPENADYPFIYVPIAEFGRVGATVTWDPQAMVIRVTSDYDQIKAENEQLRQQVSQLQADMNKFLPRGNYPWVIMNRAIVAKQNEWIFYNNPADEGSLYKIRLDGSGKQKLNSDGTRFINVIADTVFYVNLTDNNKIYRVKTDGTGRAKVSEEQATFINVVGDWIYYRDSNPYANNRLYKIKTDGSNRTALTENDVISVIVIEDYLYFSETPGNFTPTRMRFDGTGRQAIAQVPAPVFSLSGEWLYYQNPYDQNSIYRVKLDGSQNTKLNSDNSFSITALGDWVYYENASDSFSVYRMRGDGSERTKLNNQASSYVNVMDDWIYYHSNNVLYRMKLDGSNQQVFG